MSLNTKTIIQEELRRQLYGDLNVGSGSTPEQSLESLTKDQNILSCLQRNLTELSEMESKLNFIVREVRGSIKR